MFNKGNIFILILILLLLLAVTNPSEDSFKDYVKTELKSSKNDGILTTIIKGFSKIQSDLNTEYSDKVFFSTAVTSIGDERKEYIGFLGFWFKVN